MGFSEFLTRKSQNEWTSVNHDFWFFWKEFWGRSEDIDEVMSTEIQKQNSLRDAIKRSLSTNPKEQKDMAERWSLLLKNKAAIFDAWSILFTAIIALYTIGVTAFTVLSFYFEKDRPFLMIFTLILFAISLLVWKFSVDRKSSWYKQLVNYLDSISKFDDF